MFGSQSGMFIGLKPRSSVGGGQLVNTGGVVSTTVTVWLHVLVLPHTSVASQVRVMVIGQTPLVTVLRTVMAALLPLQRSKAVGGSKLQTEPHATVLLLELIIIKE